MKLKEVRKLTGDPRRDVLCALACGWSYKKVELYNYGRNAWIGSALWRPTADRRIWGGLLELFIHRGFTTIVFADGPVGLGIVDEFIRVDPLGHLKKLGLK